MQPASEKNIFKKTEVIGKSLENARHLSLAFQSTKPTAT